MRQNQSRSQSSSAISDMMSPVKLVGKIRAIALGSKPPLVTLISRPGLGTRLRQNLLFHSSLKKTKRGSVCRQEWKGTLAFLEPCKGIRIPESRTAEESGIVGLIIRITTFKESGIPLKFGVRHPSFTDKESRIHGLESRIHDCLGLSYMGRLTFSKFSINFNVHLTFATIFTIT